MRRKDKEVQDRQLIDWIISKAQVCRLGLCLNEQPYVVPISFGYDGACLYLHTALEGTKIDFWTGNPRVCFELEHDVRLLPHPDKACSWGQSFYSVIGFGEIEEVEDPQAKTYALNQVMSHYSGREWEFSEASLATVRAWQIKISEVSGKKSKDKPNSRE